jgi:hypothetical protein
MPIKPGDSVTVALSAPVALGRFTILKPMFSITRVVGDDTVEDVADLEREVRIGFFKRLQTELDLWAGCAEALGAAEDTDALAQLCMKEIGDAKITRTTAEKSASAISSSGKTPTKKGFTAR